MGVSTTYDRVLAITARTPNGRVLPHARSRPFYDQGHVKNPFDLGDADNNRFFMSPQ